MRKYRNKRECGGSKHERNEAPQKEGLPDVGEWTLFSLALCAYISAPAPGRLQALRLSLAPHATPHSSSLPLPSLHPSQEER